MAQRSFTDQDGRRWQVWEVRPKVWDRRSGDDRRGEAAPDPVIERRASGERRTRGAAVNIVKPGLERGWLCFDDGATRLRLAPIPPDWSSGTDADLEALCQRAAATQLARSA